MSARDNGWMVDGRRRSPDEQAYWLSLDSLNCDHPARFRHKPFDDGPDSWDPQEWRCGVCGTLQLRHPIPDPRLRRSVTDGQLG